MIKDIITTLRVYAGMCGLIGFLALGVLVILLVGLLII